MNVGDLIVVWFHGDKRTITGEVTKITDSQLHVLCTAEDKGTTEWVVWAKDILTIGLVKPPG